ncbi:interleukin-4 receptor subunit alpha isoform X1 [Ascaphus truei]|uniref:interleukin-4 receptor subunit alpha isoform X1 n=2 Tax=Ascaphus truei TaxID=8439 RepID=UPI003F5ACA00
MKTRGTFRMGVKRGPVIRFLWLLLFFEALSDAQSDRLISNLECFNDYDTEMFCSWERMNVKNDCSSDFQVMYAREPSKAEVCVPENMNLGGAVLPDKCVCWIEVPFFLQPDTYTIEIESNGTLVQNITVKPSQTVKPKPPTNVTVDLEKDGVMVRWHKGYPTENNLEPNLIFEVHRSNKQNPEEVNNTSLSQMEPELKIYNSLLKPGNDYIVKVRSKPSEKAYYHGTWSDWSPEVEWHNDYTIYELLKIFVPFSGALVVALILLCYYCITIYKKGQWNNIPDPAKSLLAAEILQRLHGSVLKPDVNPDMLPLTEKTQSRPCGSWLRKLIFRAHDYNDTCNQSTQRLDNYNTNGYLNLPQSGDLPRLVLEPEFTFVERFVEICPAEDDHQPSSIEVSEDDEDKEDPAHKLEFDSIIGEMFLDILGSHSLNVDTTTDENSEKDHVQHSNTPTPFINNQLACRNLDTFSFLREICQEEGSVTTHFEHSLESGYHSYNCDNSPAELQTHSDQSKIFNFDQWSKNHQESLANTQAAYLMENYADDTSKADIFLDSGYNSFASAVSSSTERTVGNVTCQEPALSLSFNRFSMSRIVGINNSHLQRYPNGSPYYNRKPCLPLYDVASDNVDFLATLTPKSDRFSFFNQNDLLHNHRVQSIEAETHPTSMCGFSEYQCFEKAIQQEKPSMSHSLGTADCTMLESGYTSYDNLLRQNIEESDPTADVFSTMRDTRDTKTNWEEDLASQLFQGSLAFPLTESCSDDDCNSIPMEIKHPSFAKDSSYQNDKGENIALANIQNNMNITLRDQDKIGIPCALTFDLSDQLKNCVDMYGDNIVSGKSKANPLRASKEAIFASTPEDLSFINFLNTPNFQPLKFENMSYFACPPHVETMFLVNDANKDSSKTISHLLWHNMLDNEKNSYMKVALS